MKTMDTLQKKSTTVRETIQQRRSIGKMTEQCPSREQIQQLLEAATHAPNHHRVEPWRFFVFAGRAREELGEVLQESLLARMEDKASEKAQALLRKERNKPLESPVVIAVVANHAHHAKVMDIENIEATAAAVQNMLLVAEEMGLAAKWRTGDAAYDPLVKRWLGVSHEDHIVAFLYIGFPAIPRVERNPTPVAQKTTWLGWE
jgi:nitroreductase